MLELLGALVGGAFRLVPELIKYFDAKNERAHELDKLEFQLKYQNLIGSQKIEEARLDADSKFDVAGLAAFAEALKGQMQLTGNAVIDFLTMSVRPITTYVLLALYVLSKAAMFTLGLQSGLTTWESIAQLYGHEDRALMAGILSFWFLGRVFDRMAR